MTLFPRRPLPLLSLVAALTLVLGACAPKQANVAATPAASATPMPESPTASAPGDAATRCNADAAKSLIGKQASDATVAEAKAAAGVTNDVRDTRVITPGAPMTADFREDRLDIWLDERNAIVRITCG
jgi:hypothetical protein